MRSSFSHRGAARAAVLERDLVLLLHAWVSELHGIFFSFFRFTDAASILNEDGVDAGARTPAGPSATFMVITVCIIEHHVSFFRKQYKHRYLYMYGYSSL
jgi:hypothetical protein